MHLYRIRTISRYPYIMRLLEALKENLLKIIFNFLNKSCSTIICKILFVIEFYVNMKLNSQRKFCTTFIYIS